MRKKISQLKKSQLIKTKINQLKNIYKILYLLNFPKKRNVKKGNLNVEDPTHIQDQEQKLPREVLSSGKTTWSWAMQMLVFGNKCLGSYL